MKETLILVATCDSLLGKTSNALFSLSCEFATRPTILPKVESTAVIATLLRIIQQLCVCLCLSACVCAPSYVCVKACKDLSSSGPSFINSAYTQMCA